MIYTALTKKAMRIAFEAHKEQTDKTGIPYIYHPTYLAEQMDDEVTTCVARLHDVIEDKGPDRQDPLLRSRRITPARSTQDILSRASYPGTE